MKKKADITKKYFQEYLEYKRLGLRKNAQKAIVSLCDSLPSLDEKIEWSRRNLKKFLRGYNNHINYVLYGRIILPALKARIEQEEPEAFYHLYRTWNNALDHKEGRDLIEKWTPRRLLERLIADHPNCKKYSDLLLTHLLGNFDYLDHEWPSGILVDQNNIPAELEELKHDIQLARSLDTEQRNTDRLEEFSRRVEEYAARVKAYKERVRLEAKGN